MQLARLVLRAVLLASVPVTLAAQASPPSPPPGALTLSGSLRMRVENWDWFGAEEASAYTFVGSLLRGGIAQQNRLVGWRLEAAAPVLVGLPDDAVAPAPRGQLGLGAGYYVGSDNSTNPAMLFVKQAFLRIGQPPGQGRHWLRLGRFEFVDGAETSPARPTLAAIKREHIAQRLLGTFAFTHVGRSFDGAHYVFDAPSANVTLVAALPTSGAFDVDGWNSLDVRFGYGAFTRPFKWGSGASEARVFGLLYNDRRNGLKSDNRPLAARQADRDDITITTIGAHYLHGFTLPHGEADLLLWGALQTGDWGVQSHRAGAGVVELGYQAPPVRGVRPWLRLGYARTSGDEDPADGRHGTFFQVLPSIRPYARFPFYNMMNTEDAFGSLELRGAKVSLRSDVHRVRLSQASDLWYMGSGAFERESFGYGGRPSGGQRGFGTLIDIGLEYRPGPHLSLSAYSGWVRGGDVIAAVYPTSRSGRLFYLEGEVRR
jgi:hypothetical protein